MPYYYSFEVLRVSFTRNFLKKKSIGGTSHRYRTLTAQKDEHILVTIK
jgi:hypothetical protein